MEMRDEFRKSSTKKENSLASLIYLLGSYSVFPLNAFIRYFKLLLWLFFHKILSWYGIAVFLKSIGIKIQ